MTSSRISWKYNPFRIEIKLRRSLRNYPVVSLITVIKRNGRRVVWGLSIVNREYRDISLIHPYSGIVLTTTGAHSYETSSMKVNDKARGFFYRDVWKNSYLNIIWRIIITFEASERLMDFFKWFLLKYSFV